MAIDLRFIEIPAKPSSKEIIIGTLDLRPRKICFSSTHKTSLKRKAGNGSVGIFSVPFGDTIKPIFEQFTRSKLFLSQDYGNYWCFIKSDADYEQISQFFIQYGDIVFLKDSLELSIALAENFSEDEERSYLGDLEYKAKYSNDEHALKEIISLTTDWLNKLPFYNKADFICAVPPSINGKDNLPRQIVKGLNGFGFQNISDNVYWKQNKEGLKEVQFSEKYDILDSTGLSINCNIKDKVIILVDDLYQSGVTMQFIAKELKLAGASKILGLAIVKSRRNTDNI
jgi:hypothetical protein